MPYRKIIKPLQGGHIMAECGPMRLVISAYIGKLPQPDAAGRAAEESFGLLERIAGLREVLGRRTGRLPKDIDDPLALEMIQSVLKVGDEDLTPMAAVAGTIADGVAEYLMKRGMTRVIVNNGGDVAVRLLGDEPVKIGIRPDVDHPEGSHVLLLDPGRRTWGIATSGLGGRSFTRGVASAVTILSERASVADAAATAVANASFVAGKKVIRRRADEIDPDTDLKGMLVTVKVGRLEEAEKTLALSLSMARANDLVRRGIILGAFASVQGATAMTDFFRHMLLE